MNGSERQDNSLEFALRRSIQIASEGASAVTNFYRPKRQPRRKPEEEQLAYACEVAARLTENEFLKEDLLQAAERLREMRVE